MQLGLRVGRHGAVIIEVVAGQVGEPGGLEAQAVQPLLLQPVAGGFQRHMGDAVSCQFGQGVGERDGIRGGQAGGGGVALCDDAQRAQ